MEEMNITGRESSMTKSFVSEKTTKDMSIECQFFSPEVLLLQTVEFSYAESQRA